MSSQVINPPRRNHLTTKHGGPGPSTVKKSVLTDNGSSNGNGNNGNSAKPTSPPHQSSVGGERTVKTLRLSKALTIPEGTTVSDACRRMAARRVDAVLLTDANALLLLLTRVAIVSPSDPVYVAAKKMRDLRVNSVIITTGNKPQGILTSKDVLMRVVAQNLSPELTLVEKVMTSDPECATLETTILDALHIMHDGKFLHLPVVDKDGCLVACIDVLQITHAAISMVEGSSGAVNDMATTMMQKFWDSALALDPPEDDYDTQSEMSAFMASDGVEQGKSYPSLGLGNTFAFKFEDRKGRVHRLNCGTENLEELVSTVVQRIGTESDQDRPQFLYEDDEGDKVLLTIDSDLAGAVSHARTTGLKVLRLHLGYSESPKPKKKQLQEKGLDTTASGTKTGFGTLQTGIMAGTIVLTGLAVVVYLKRSKG
ncbi:hypothetical protein MKX01_035206 [Papaver californicum]|nr:hypothetical protein MKX01_035206 [Papaver californicum]